MDYTIRRSPRARRVRVSVDGSGEVEVVLPRRAPERAAAAGGARARGLDRAPRAARSPAPPRRSRGRPAPCPSSAATCGSCPQPGRERVHRRGDDAAGAQARRRAGARALVPPPGARRDRRAARRRHRPRTARPTTASRSAARRRAGRRARSRGHMSFNWRLLLAPEDVLDYVVEHEVCHLERARTTRRASGRCSSRASRTGASTRAGCAATARRSCSERLPRTSPRASGTCPPAPARARRRDAVEDQRLDQPARP